MTTTTVTKVVSEAGHADVSLACGHNFGLAALPLAHPVVGHAYDCHRCTSDAWEAEHPLLPDEQIAAIAAGMPKCPTCQGDIKYVHFIVHSNHQFDYEIDPQNGDVLAYSRHDYDVERQPSEVYANATLPGWPATYEQRRLGIEVECEQKHTWNEPRLKLRRDDLDDESWDILPSCPLAVCVSRNSDGDQQFLCEPHGRTALQEGFGLRGLAPEEKHRPCERCKAERS